MLSRDFKNLIVYVVKLLGEKMLRLLYNNTNEGQPGITVVLRPNWAHMGYSLKSLKTTSQCCYAVLMAQIHQGQTFRAVFTCKTICESQFQFSTMCWKPNHWCEIK